MKVKVGAITKIRTGKLDANAASPDGIYPFFTCSKEPLHIDTYSYDCECVLVAGNGDLNVKYYNGKFDAYQRTYIIEDDSKGILHLPYLYYFMESYIEVLRKKSIGGVIKYIKLGNLTDAEIELPSIEKQKEICTSISSIREMITVQKKKVSLLDELVKARFVELFGDPINNNKQWPISTVGAIATDVKYGTSRPATKGGKFPYLRMNNLTYDGYLDLTDLKYIDIPDNEYEKCVVRRGDILFNRTNSVDLIGKTVAYDRPDEMIIAGYIIRVRLNEKLLPEVFSQYMNLEVMKKTLSSMAKGAVHQANINAQELKSIEVYLPDIGLQREFVAFKQHIDKSKFEVQKKIDLYTELLNKKMDEYFNSEAN